MKIFTLQVLTGDEDLFIDRCKRLAPLTPFYPKRALFERRRGIQKKVVRPIFPGYVFLQANEIRPDILWEIKRIEGFCRFLRANHDIVPLSDQDASTVSHFMSFGPSADTSTVSFDENDRVKVISGPLTGQEAKIVKVDRRKRRIRVVLSLYENSFPIDLAFVTVEKLVGGAARANEDDAGKT
jgi:transcriptional antiterminator NusG